MSEEEQEGDDEDFIAEGTVVVDFEDEGEDGAAEGEDGIEWHFHWEMAYGFLYL